MTHKNINSIIGVRAAIFDLDGTLFDSTHVWERIDIEFLKKRDLVPTLEYRRAFAALGNREGAVFTVGYYNLSDTPEQIMQEWADMARHEYETSIELFDGVREYLIDTYRQGIKLAAVTSLARELAVPCLAHNGVISMFDAVITADETGLSKTSPEIYEYTASVLGVPCDNCVVFDDVARAVRSAKKAGMTTVAVRGAGGYDDGDEVRDGDADYIIDGIKNAPKLVAESASRRRD